MLPNTAIPHPDTGNLSFGFVPELNTRGVILPEGEIRLLRGRHFAPNKGFGVAHIWAEHQRQMANVGLFSADDVPRYVALIVAAGVPLFYSGESFRQTKLTVLRVTVGKAIIEHRMMGETSIWSVVTAFGGKRRHGTRVGSVR